MSKLLTWRVDPPPTGQWRSFERRGWPSANFANGEPAVTLNCETEYSPRCAKSGEHAELQIHVAIPNKHNSFDWRIMKQRARTLVEAKEIAGKFLAEHPEFHPTKED